MMESIIRYVGINTEVIVLLQTLAKIKIVILYYYSVQNCAYDIVAFNASSQLSIRQ
jgi:hypothetical protein